MNGSNAGTANGVVASGSVLDNGFDNQGGECCGQQSDGDIEDFAYWFRVGQSCTGCRVCRRFFTGGRQRPILILCHNLLSCAFEHRSLADKLDHQLSFSQGRRVTTRDVLESVTRKVTTERFQQQNGPMPGDRGVATRTYITLRHEPVLCDDTNPYFQQKKVAPPAGFEPAIFTLKG